MNIHLNNVSVVYQKKTPFEFTALKDISTEFNEGKFYGVIGHTGSGKSTLVQLLNGLILPTTGEVKVGDDTLLPKTKQKVIHRVKGRVGIVFQFPEHQLFDETVLKDVTFGPINMGKSKEEAEEISKYYLKRLNVDESLFDESPFDLSGGQMRKIALAGILAMEPDVLILDEPTAGLDPLSHIETMDLFKSIHETLGITIILVTHDMNDVFNYTDEVKILSKGALAVEGNTQKLLQDETLLKDYQLEVPNVVRLVHDLRQKGYQLDEMPRNIQAFISTYKGVFDV